MSPLSPGDFLALGAVVPTILWLYGVAATIKGGTFKPGHSRWWMAGAYVVAFAIYGYGVLQSAVSRSRDELLTAYTDSYAPISPAEVVLASRAPVTSTTVLTNPMRLLERDARAMSSRLIFFARSHGGPPEPEDGFTYKPGYADYLDNLHSAYTNEFASDIAEIRRRFAAESIIDTEFDQLTWAPIHGPSNLRRMAQHLNAMADRLP